MAGNQDCQCVLLALRTNFDNNMPLRSKRYASFIKNLYAVRYLWAYKLSINFCPICNTVLRFRSFFHDGSRANNRHGLGNFQKRKFYSLQAFLDVLLVQPKISLITQSREGCWATAQARRTGGGPGRWVSYKEAQRRREENLERRKILNHRIREGYNDSESNKFDRYG